MQIDKVKFAQVVSEAKSKAAGNPRWLAAIEKAADAIINGKWIITELFDGILITTESGETYKANGLCQCKAFAHGQACKHRAAARLIELYNEALASRPVATATVLTSAAISIPITPAAERAALIAGIKATWRRVEPHLPLETELLARFGKNQLEMLDTDMLRRVSLAIAM